MLFTALLLFSTSIGVDGQGLTLMLSNQSISAGSDVVITDIGDENLSDGLICVTDRKNCCSSALGYRQGHWIYNNTFVDEHFEGRFHVDRSLSQVILLRRNDSLGPLGSYCCVVGTIADPNATICVNITIGLVITVSQVVIPVEGSPYTLVCTIFGHQLQMNFRVEYQWFSNSNLLQGQTNSMLHFNPIDRYDNGTYTCQVTISSPLLDSNITASNSTIVAVVTTSQQPTSITLTWTQPLSGVSYTVQYNASVRGCSDVPPTQGGPTTISSNQRSFRITTLEEDSEVSVNITAVGIMGSASTTLTTSTLTSRPGQLQNLRSIGATSNSITVRWDELSCVGHNGGLTGYVVEYGTTAFDNITTVPATQTSFNATDLLPFTNYMFSVAAVNDNGTGHETILDRELCLPSEVILWHNGSQVSNNSIVDPEGITFDNDLFCFTNNYNCCRNIHTGMTGARGFWFFPNGTEVVRSGLRRYRGRSFIALNNYGRFEAPLGLYHCVIPDFTGQNVDFFVGLYNQSQGVLNITAPIEYNFISSTLTCISSGGPATTVTWTRDDVPISQSTSTQQQLVTNTSAATYHNLLTITSTNIRDYNGTFTCNVSNSRGTSNTEIFNLDLRKELGTNSLISGNRLFQLGETTSIMCSIPAPVQSIQWVDEFNTTVRNGTLVQKLELNIRITSSSNNTRYTCRVSDVELMWSQTITVGVADDNLPRLPDLIVAVSTETTITISWDFTTLLDSRNETFTVMYGTIPGELRIVSHQVLSMPNIQQYSVQLRFLQPGTRYYYQINSTNGFESLTSEERDIKTMDAKSTVVRDVESEAPNSTTLVLTWLPPQLTNGDILNYIVRITLNFNDRIAVTEDAIINTTITERNLVPGVPYDISIVPVNRAGEGDISTSTLFTQELTPNVDVANVVVERTSPTSMDVSWRPLTLSEARGFVTFYSIAYTPTPNSRRRQAPQDTMYMNASADSSSVTIQGLDRDLAYSVTVAGGTRAGVGVQSSNRVADKQSDPTCSTGTEAIVGGVGGVFFILSITGNIILFAIFMKSRKSQYNTTIAATKNNNADISKVSDEGPAYEVIRKEEGKTSMMQRQSPVKSEENFVLKECPAYGPVDKSGGKKTKDEDSNVYETLSSV